MGKNEDLLHVNTTKFDELSLSPELLKATADMGFTEASPIQARAIPLIVAGKDVVGLAMTGTGKTAAFSLPLIDKIDPFQKHSQALILCPTRELAIQVCSEITKFLKYKKNISVLAVYGGQLIDTQLRALRKGVQIIVGTPGRLIDHIERRSINLSTISSVVLDEADEMLDMGFRPDIEKILQRTPASRQTVMFSATMPSDIVELVKKYQKDPQMVQVSNKNSAATTVEQHYYEVRSGDRFALLQSIMQKNNPYLSIVFCNTKHRVDDVTHKLMRLGISAEALHSDIRQAKRNKIMSRFRSGDLQVLVATDVAARGIDIPNIDIIFNFEIPKDEKSYVHRIGRTGRAGKNGLAVSFVSERDGFAFRNIKRCIQANLIRQAVPVLPQQSAEPRYESSHEPREQRRDSRESREMRAPRESREPRMSRERREPREDRMPRAMREPREDRFARDMREPREDRFSREARAPREMSFSAEPREKGLEIAVQTILQRNGLSEQIKVIESLVTQENTPTKIAAALAYLLAEKAHAKSQRSS